jgi:hypothetical protein
MVRDVKHQDYLGLLVGNEGACLERHARRQSILQCAADQIVQVLETVLARNVEINFVEVERHCSSSLLGCELKALTLRSSYTPKPRVASNGIARCVLFAFSMTSAKGVFVIPARAAPFADQLSCLWHQAGVIPLHPSILTQIPRSTPNRFTIRPFSQRPCKE